MKKLSTLTMSARKVMVMIFYIGSISIPASLVFLASCSKDLKAPKPFPFETGVLSASRNAVVFDADSGSNEAVTFSLATDPNSLIKYTLILTAGNKTDSVAVTQNTVSKDFTESELNSILIDSLGLAIGVTADLSAQVKGVIPSNGKTAQSNVITIKVTPSKNSLPPNLVQGGNFNPADSSKWTVSNITPGVTVSFVNGTALFSGGSWGQAAIYQAIQVQANQKYQIDMNVAGSGATDVWFEVYVGKAEPQQGVDYNDGGIRLSLNTWDGCGNTPFNGLLTDISCTGVGKGIIQFATSGTVYLLIKSGGGSLGTTGISVDNVQIRAIK